VLAARWATLEEEKRYRANSLFPPSWSSKKISPLFSPQWPPKRAIPRYLLYPPGPTHQKARAVAFLLIAATLSVKNHSLHEVGVRLTRRYLDRPGSQ